MFVFGLLVEQGCFQKFISLMGRETQRRGRNKSMQYRICCVALSLSLVGGSPVSGEILQGVMAIKGAEMD